MREILGQSAFLFFAQIAVRIVGFFYTIFLANSLQVSDFGLYSLGVAYFSIISSLSDFGFNRFLIREIAKERSKQWELIWNLVMLRLTMVCIFFAIFSIVLYLFDPDKIRVSIILLASLAVLPQAVAVSFDGIFIALRKLQFSAIASIIGSLTIAFLGFVLISRGFGVFGAINAIIFGQFILAIVLILLLYRKEGLKAAQIKLSVIKKALIGSLPYGLLAILGLLYFRVDTILLSYLKGNFETGIYAAGYKFLETLVFIPNALSFALFPRFVSLHQENPKAIRDLMIKSIKLMFFLGILVALAYYLILPSIIRVLLPQFINAISVIKILALAIPFIFLHVSAAQIVLSEKRYLWQLVAISFLPIVLNIILNLIFIPQYGYIAASWITVISDVLSFLVLFIFIHRYYIRDV